MRPGSWVLILSVAWFALAQAKPKPAPPDKLAAYNEQLRKLQTEYSTDLSKQAYVAAVKAARQLVELQSKQYGSSSRQVVQARGQLASALNMAGAYGEALKIYRELVDDAEKEHGADSDQVTFALQMETGPLWQQNRLDEILAINQRVLAIAKKVHGEDSVEYARELQTIAQSLFLRNEYSAALADYEQAMKILEQLQKAKPQDEMIRSSLQSTVQVLASYYWQTNQRPKAMEMFDRTIKMAETAPHATPMTIGSALWSVAATYHYGNRDDLAKPMMKRAMEIYDKEIARLEKDKPDDYELSAMLGMSGYMLQQMGDAAGAEQRMDKAIAIDEKRATGYSGWTTMLAELKRQAGKPKEALALYEHAAASLAKTSPTSAKAYNVAIAIVYKDLGDYKNAEKLLLDSLATSAKQYGRHHPYYGMSEIQLAFVYMAAGNVASAEKVLADALEISEKEAQLVLKTGTDSDHATYFARNGYLVDTAINFNARLAPKSSGATRLALTTLLRRKGRILDAAAASLATIRAKLSPEDKQLLDELADARAKLAKLTVAGPTATGDPDEYAKELAMLEEEVLKLELQLGKKSAAYRAVSTPIELAPIQKLIPKDARLVELVNYQPSDPKSVFTTTMALPPRRYAAYIVGPTGDPRFVDLASAADVDQAVTKFRKAVSDPDNDRATELGRALYDLTMAKIVPLLGGSSNILIAPDGTLNVVPFSALVDEKGDFLVKKLTFTYLTSGRDLLRLSVKTKAQGGGVIFADPSFDSTGKPAAAGDASGSRGRRSLELSSLTWPRLPGTAKEADAVAKTWRGLKVLSGQDATEAAVKAVHGPKILHLATHGFFLPDEAPTPAANENGGSVTPLAAAMMPAQAAPASEIRENPLLRSGLAFAGANKLASGDEDGILTALEASGLDLEGTKLVVLSACETGVGKVTNGDGVYGLRRALVIAGAESLVMSLWQVDDEATKDLMVGYYSRLASGKSRSSALREVQLELQARDKYKHPYYWASFLPAGDNSPLKE
jgi:CHAT domain-containing protein